MMEWWRSLRVGDCVKYRTPDRMRWEIARVCRVVSITDVGFVIALPSKPYRQAEFRFDDPRLSLRVRRAISPQPVEAET